MRFCAYCGVRLNVIGENLGKMILSNTDAIRQALSLGQSLGHAAGEGMHVVAFKDLNAEYFMPLVDLSDDRIVLALLHDEGGIRYELAYPDEDPIALTHKQLEGFVREGLVRQWLSGWQRCSTCHTRFHVSRSINGFSMVKCPVCLFDAAVLARDTALRFYGGPKRDKIESLWAQLKGKRPVILSLAESPVTTPDDLAESWNLINLVHGLCNACSDG